MNIYDCTAVGKNIKKLREKLELSKVDLAKAMGVIPNTIANWENGKQIPNGIQLIALAEYFRISIDWLCQSHDSTKETMTLCINAWEYPLYKSITEIERICYNYGERDGKVKARGTTP